MAAKNLGVRYKEAVHPVNAALYNEKTAKSADQAVDAATHGDAKGYVKNMVEANKDAAEALGQKYKDTLHATNAKVYNEKTAGVPLASRRLPSPLL